MVQGVNGVRIAFYVARHLGLKRGKRKEIFFFKKNRLQRLETSRETAATSTSATTPIDTNRNRNRNSYSSNSNNIYVGNHINVGCSI